MILEQCAAKWLCYRYSFIRILNHLLFKIGLMTIQHAQKVLSFYKEKLNMLNMHEIVID
ncbi:hypothetical protein ACT7DL_30450 [Bacillus paranthracis]